MDHSVERCELRGIGIERGTMDRSVGGRGDGDLKIEEVDFLASSLHSELDRRQKGIENLSVQVRWIYLEWGQNIDKGHRSSICMIMTCDR